MLTFTASAAGFIRAHPCPATGATRAACPGGQANHAVLCAGRTDAVEKTAWRSVLDHQLKTKLDVMECKVQHWEIAR